MTILNLSLAENALGFLVGLPVGVILAFIVYFVVSYIRRRMMTQAASEQPAVNHAEPTVTQPHRN